MFQMKYKQCIGLLLGVFIMPALFLNGQSKQKTLLFIGSYTEGVADTGIYIYEFMPATGALKKCGTGKNLINPSFITISANGQFLYACTETKLPRNGSISAFRIDSVNGTISYINKQDAGGENPVYLSIHNSGNWLVNANYTGSSASVFKLNANGSVQSYTQLLHFSDSSINTLRQEKSHPHAAVFSPDQRYILIPDLGGDKIRVFSCDTSRSSPAIISEQAPQQCIAGSGPRHFTFHPNAKFAYCIEELSGMVSAYTYSNGNLKAIQRIFSYSKKQDSYGSSDIHLSPDGKFLYASNRWEEENTIAIYAVNPVTGKLRLVGHQSTFGDHPRNFTIDPSGHFLLVANLSTNNIVVFKRHAKTGLLTKTPYEITVPRPSCLQMRVYGQ